jgi:hypothetical protein
MTIDELAGILEHFCRDREDCHSCPFDGDCPLFNKTSFADWLKKEVKHHD